MNKPVNTEENLEREGWRLASVTGGNHLKRIMEMYQDIEVEVHVEEVEPEECSGCVECYRLDNEIMYRVYSREKVNRQADNRTERTE